MIISVSKKELFDEVEKRSSLEGSILPERFEGVWASEEEGQFLDSYWLEGYTAVIQLLKRYLSGQTVSHNLSTYDKDEVLTIEATMPARYNSLLDGSVSTDVKMLIACNILHGWLEIKATDVASKYEEEAKGYTEDLRVKLLYRNEPTSKMVSADNDNASIVSKSGDDSLYAKEKVQCERNIYPADEYIGHKCACGEIPMKQGWNNNCGRSWYEDQERIAREKIMRGCL